MAPQARTQLTNPIPLQTKANESPNEERSQMAVVRIYLTIPAGHLEQVKETLEAEDRKVYDDKSGSFEVDDTHTWQ